MGIMGWRRQRGFSKGDVFAVLDVGTTKVACFVVRLGDGLVPRVIGIGHNAAAGVRAGAVVGLDKAEAAVAHAVATAEEMAGVQVSGVIVNISGGHPASQTLHVDVDIDGHEIGDADLRRVQRAQDDLVLPEDHTVLHCEPVGFTLDGEPGIQDPRGMVGNRLTAHIHAVTVDKGARRNLETAIQRSHLAVHRTVVSPYASGLATAVTDERELGCAVIDLGGGTTTVAVFFEGRLVFTDCLPVGGAHITHDIARGLSTSIGVAERLKTLYGAAVATVADETETITVPQVGEDERTASTQMPKSYLTAIVQPRLEETLELVRSRLEASGFDKVVGRQVVLTGGGSALPMVRDLAQLVLDKQVRLGRPMRLEGQADAVTGPAFATVAGLIQVALSEADKPSLPLLSLEPASGGSGLLKRMGGWFRDHL